MMFEIYKEEKRGL
jgi:chromosome segregation ATPase